MNPTERLELISLVYDWLAKYPIQAKGHGHNGMREHPISWDFAQVAGAIAGDYQIELSPHYKGVQRLRKNTELWAKVSPFVALKAGQGCLPHDEGVLGLRWQREYGKGKAA